MCLLTTVTKRSFIKSLKTNKQDDNRLVGNLKVLCKNDNLVIAKPLQRRAVGWYRHYLQHPGHTRLEETIKTVMYWTDMRDTVRTNVKTCQSDKLTKSKMLNMENFQQNWLY